MERSLEQLLIDHGYLVPSYTKYGGGAGLQSLGPLGLRFRNRLLEKWRHIFMTPLVDEVETPILTPYKVLQSSGHVDRFTDFVCEDIDGRKYRVDHLLQEEFEKRGLDPDQVDGMTPEEQEKWFRENGLLLPGNLPPVLFREEKMMYQASPDLFLRPELAQGIFLAFPELARRRRNNLPFGIAQVGRSYRKEISPKPFTRMREFSQAEIEFFYNPLDANHPDFEEVAERKLPFLSYPYEKVKVLTLREAVEKKLLSNQIIGYFLAKIWEFALSIGLDPERLRLRQHHENEMAHYASCCWDLEAQTASGWLECVGCADRGCYDLSVHNADDCMVMKVPLKEPKTVTKLTAKYDKREMGKLYRGKFPQVQEKLASLSQDELKMVRDLFAKDYVYSFDINMESHIVKPELVTIVEETHVIKEHQFVPYVVEPSFGIDRLMYAVFSHSYWKREGKETRSVLSLTPSMAPWLVGVYQLSNHTDLLKKTKEVQRLLHHSYTDYSSASIGKRYVRCDEIGIPFIITVDFQTLDDETVTIRERDSMKQSRCPIIELEKRLKELTSE